MASAYGMGVGSKSLFIERAWTPMNRPFSSLKGSVRAFQDEMAGRSAPRIVGMGLQRFLHASPKFPLAFRIAVSRQAEVP